MDYDILPKYCKRCKRQECNEDDCRIIHPELRNQVPHGEDGMGDGKTKNMLRNKVSKWNPTSRRFTRLPNVEVTTEIMQVVGDLVPVDNYFSVNAKIENNKREGEKIYTK